MSPYRRKADEIVDLPVNTRQFSSTAPRRFTVLQPHIAGRVVGSLQTVLFQILLALCNLLIWLV